MSPLAVSCVVFACIAGAGLLAMALGRALPEHHLRPDSKEAIKYGLTLIATLAALVLGLLVAAAKGTYWGIIFSCIGLATFDERTQKGRWMAGWGLGLSIVYMLMSLAEHGHFR